MRNLNDKLGKIEYFLDQRTSEFDNKYINFGGLLLKVYLKYYILPLMNFEFSVLVKSNQYLTDI